MKSIWSRNRFKGSCRTSTIITLKNRFLRTQKRCKMRSETLKTLKKSMLKAQNNTKKSPIRLKSLQITSHQEVAGSNSLEPESLL